MTTRADARIRRIIRSYPLTPRECEVTEYVCLGYNTPNIADALDVSPSTVRTHMRNVLRNVGADSQAHLLSMVLQGVVRDFRRR